MHEARESTDDKDDEEEEGKGEPEEPKPKPSKWDAETQTLRAERNNLRQVETLKHDLESTRVLMTDSLAAFRHFPDVADHTLTSPKPQPRHANT
eukprot:6083754-Amphidinium_carterae.1